MSLLPAIETSNVSFHSASAARYLCFHYRYLTLYGLLLLLASLLCKPTPTFLAMVARFSPMEARTWFPNCTWSVSSIAFTVLLSFLLPMPRNSYWLID